MINDPLEEKAMEAYKKFMAGEVARPEVEQHKRLFVTRHFRVKPIWARGAGVLVPAMAVFCLFLLFHTGIPQLKNLNAPSAENPKISSSEGPLVTAEAPSHIEVTNPKKLKKIAIKVPPILVKRATSEMGQPMIYQQKINEKPVAVVWVFTGTKMST